MWEAVKGLLASRKALAAIAGTVVGLVAKLGGDLDTESLVAVLAPIMAYILGQGIADAGAGKEAKKAANGSS